MLKEQLFCLAMKAYSQAYEAKERIKNTIKSDAVQIYMQNLKAVAITTLENQWQKFNEKEQIFSKVVRRNSKTRTTSTTSKKDSVVIPIPKAKKSRKSSIKPAKEIGSRRADLIMQNLKEGSFRLVEKTDELDGKKSLAYLVWALGHAQKASINDGISVHDVSALLYRACKIELYPINISRVIYGNQTIVRKAGQEKRTKTYLLTEAGENLFKEKFV